MNACPQCRTPTVPGQDRCGRCGLVLLDPRQETVLWRGRASLRALGPAFVRSAILAAVVLVFTRGLLARAPEWVCHLDARACGELDFEVLAKIAGAAPWVEWVGLAFVGLGLLRTALKLISLRYRVSTQRIVSERGLLARRVDELDLRLLRDSATTQGILQRLLDTGSVVLLSRDPTHPRLVMEHVESPEQLRETIRRAAYAQTSVSPWAPMVAPW